MKKLLVPICYSISSVLSVYLALREDSVLWLVIGVVWLVGAIVHFKNRNNQREEDGPEE